MFQLVLSRWSEFACGSKVERQWGNLAAAGAALKEMVSLLRLEGGLPKNSEPGGRTASEQGVWTEDRQ